MLQLTYISTAQPGLFDADLESVLATSRRNNRRDGVTGILVSDGKRFLQTLEGDKSTVEDAFLRIKGDDRHRAAVVLSLRDTQVREFGSWDMACERVRSAADGRSVPEIVDALVAQIPDANTRALFSSFARIDRSKVA